MSCWIPGPWEEAWAPGLRLKRQREEAAAKAEALERKQKAAAKRKATKEPAATK